MSTALLDDKLMPDEDFQRFVAAHPEIMEDVEKEKEISHRFDLPYGAGYSKSGNRIYIDRHVPVIWTMKKIVHTASGKQGDRSKSVTIKTHITKYPERHEAFESACIRILGFGYEEAHHYAVRAEWTLITSDGYDWKTYESQWTPLIKADEVEKLERVPPDLDLTPYEGTKLHQLLLDRIAATKKTARGKFLKPA